MGLITIAVYQFVRLENLQELRERFKAKCSQWGFKGTVLLAPEGINCFLAGDSQNLLAFRQFLEKDLGLKNLCYKENPCSEAPFTRMLVKIKKEIIPMGDPDIRPDIMTAPYIAPVELKNWLDEGKDFILLDTRNHYEVSVGTFRNAIHLNLKTFRDFAEGSKQLPDEIKEKPVVMFCTGGIRCEKASAYFLKTGFKKVYQLEGGILKYFEDCKDAHFDGNCFVFDWRLAVDPNLDPQQRSQEEPINAGRHRAESIG